MEATRLDLSKIRHDLRGPINQIIGYCELLIEEEGLPPGFLPDLRRVRTGGQQLLVVIEDYFDESRFSERRRDLHQLNHDLRTPVNHIIGYCEMLEEQAVEGGRKQLLEDLSRIRVAAQTWLALMEEHLLPIQTGDVANPFYLMASPVVTFHTLAPRSAEVAALSGKGKVLVVDDDPGNRELLSRRLLRHGFQVHTAMSGLEALHRLRAEPHDLVLLDLIMPGIDGYQVLTKLKADPGLRHIPILMISGLDQENGIARCIEAGADDYLTKPFDPVLLRARIGACLERKRLRDQEQAIYQALVASQRTLVAELAEAGAYVESLLPPPLVEGPVLADWSFQPSAALGGDSFGYHWVAEGQLACYLLDVCGHGVGAALLSVSALNVLRSGPIWEGNREHPERVLAALNRMFPMEAQHQQYFTLWLGVYSLTTRRLRFASGGHPPALLFRPAGGVQELRTPGPPVGAIPEAQFQSQEVEVPPGSRLFVLSDGVYERVGPDGRTATLREFVGELETWSQQPAFHPAQVLEAARSRSPRSVLEDDFSLVRLGFPGS